VLHCWQSINELRRPLAVIGRAFLDQLSNECSRMGNQVITSNIEAILIVTGALTATMLAQFVAPLWTLRHTFGEVPSGAVSIVLARHWGLLLFCVGALLVYSAFHPTLREPAVVLASIEKAGFVACVFGTSLRRRLMSSIMAAADTLMVFIFALYLVGH
jgi:hypothetical protein